MIWNISWSKLSYTDLYLHQIWSLIHFARITNCMRFVDRRYGMQKVKDVRSRISQSSKNWRFRRCLCVRIATQSLQIFTKKLFRYRMQKISKAASKSFAEIHNDFDPSENFFFSWNEIRLEFMWSTRRSTTRFCGVVRISAPPTQLFNTPRIFDHRIFHYINLWVSNQDQI